jgi:uncharacterized protein (TIGR03382 family)
MRRVTTFLAVAGFATMTGSALANDDVISFPTFTLFGGESITFTVELPPNNKTVTGFSFTGHFDDLANDASWASDLRLDILAPDGQDYAIGGFDNPSNLWDFDGPGSDGDGVYSHDGHGTFDNAPKGVWTFKFTNDWGPSGGHTWSDVVITLHKVPAPGALALLGVAGLLGGRRRR